MGRQKKNKTEFRTTTKNTIKKGKRDRPLGLEKEQRSSCGFLFLSNPNVLEIQTLVSGKTEYRPDHEREQAHAGGEKNHHRPRTIHIPKRLRKTVLQLSYNLVDAAAVYSARDLFECGHAAGEEVVGHEAGDAHHRCAPVVELLELGQALTKWFEGRRGGGGSVVVLRY